MTGVARWIISTIRFLVRRVLGLGASYGKVLAVVSLLVTVLVVSCGVVEHGRFGFGFFGLSGFLGFFLGLRFGFGFGSSSCQGPGLDMVFS